MSTHDEIKKRLDGLEEAYRNGASSGYFSSLVQEHLMWLITQLRASLEREEKLIEINKLAVIEYIKIKDERDELRHKCSGIYQAGHYLALQGQLDSSKAFADDIIESLKNELDDYRDILEKYAHIPIANDEFNSSRSKSNQFSPAKEVLAKYPREDK